MKIRIIIFIILLLPIILIETTELRGLKTKWMVYVWSIVLSIMNLIYLIQGK